MNYPDSSAVNLTMKIFFTILILAVSHFSSASGGDATKSPEAEHYRVVGNNVDPATFVGWKVYHKVCVQCHGTGGSGTEEAPDLTKSIKYLTPDQFRIKVLHTYAVTYTLDDWRNMEQAMYEEIIKQEQRDRGMLETMPRWQYSPAVKANIRNIYRYLKARSDGVIDKSRPGVLKDR